MITRYEIGRIIGTTTLRAFRFVIKEGMEEYVKRDEFVIVKESVSGRDVIGTVKDITVSNDLLPDEFGRDIYFEDLILKEGEYPTPVVKVLGCTCESGLEIPRFGIIPGGEVYLADDDILNRLLFQDPGKSAHIGNVSTRENVDVRLSINDMISRHCAVLAMTGSGKSYTVGVLIEELMKKKASVVVFDPHGEYVEMEFADSDVRVYGTKGENKIKIETSTLRTQDFINLAPDITKAQNDLLDESLDLLSKYYEKYDLNRLHDLLRILYNVKNKAETELDVFPSRILEGITKSVSLSTIGALMRRISRLERMDMFAVDGTGIDKIIKKNQLTIIDLSDADERLSETIMAAISRAIFSARKRYVKRDTGMFYDEQSPNQKTYMQNSTYIPPALIIVEEAHNFAPRGNHEISTVSRSILRKIAREGRKFGVGLCIVSQRPNKLDADILSQCNTQIIMKIVNPSDQEYIRQSVESVTEDIVRDLPSLSRGEAIVSGSATRVAVPVKIKRRITKIGGSDINLVNEWML